jgi:isopenicillin N synthase-like dioxygenase
MTVDKPETRWALPVLDASRFASGIPAKREAYARELLESLQAHGFVRIVNHGISLAMAQEAFAMVSFQEPLCV